MSKQGFFSIGEAAQFLSVSIDTLRRWETKGLLKANRFTPGGYRYYDPRDLEVRLSQIESLAAAAERWALWTQGSFEPPHDYYCQSPDVFSARLDRLRSELEKRVGKDMAPTIAAAVGEIGNNSFDHNVGSWPDIRGIFFGYNLDKGEIVLADRGQGILATLQKVRPKLSSDLDALIVAFTEVVSGRSPEARGNGLKFVRNTVRTTPIQLEFSSGDYEITMKRGTENMRLINIPQRIRGCLAIIKILT